MYEHPGKLIVALVVVLHGATPATTHIIADNSRIAGGSYAKDIDTGFLVGIVNFAEELTCGGTIINKDTILTAANCRDYHPLSVHVGTKHYSLDQGLTIRIKAFHPHPKYKPNGDYDIALVRLESPLNFSSAIRPIQLADSGEALKEGSSATVFGWGTTEFSDYSNKLLYKKVEIAKPEDCTKRNPITDRMLCVGLGGFSVAWGDFGGPLVQGDKVIGIASHSISPAIYTRVAALRSWVDETLAEHYNETL